MNKYLKFALIILAVDVILQIIIIGLSMMSIQSQINKNTYKCVTEEPSIAAYLLLPVAALFDMPKSWQDYCNNQPQ